MDSRVLATHKPPTTLGTASTHCARERNYMDPAIMVFFSFSIEFLVLSLFPYRNIIPVSVSLFIWPSMGTCLFSLLLWTYYWIRANLNQFDLSLVNYICKGLVLRRQTQILGYMLSTPVHKASSLKSPRCGTGQLSQHLNIFLIEPFLMFLLQHWRLNREPT